MDEFMVPLAFMAIFIGVPWVILHYVSQWKRAPKITEEDERLLDDMYTLARRLEERLNTVERIVAADNPDWRNGLNAPADPRAQLNAPPMSTFPIDRQHSRSN
jgi:phage shock protein B